jgi:uncharacterized integral membrane protein (TIGR00698 family)
MIKNKINPPIFLIYMGSVICLTPYVNSAAALLFGAIIAIFFGNPISHKTKIFSQKLLSYSIMGLGAGMNLIEVGKAGLNGISITAVSISATILIGLYLGKLIKSDTESSILISVGTAICGGSAIAAVGPAIRSKGQSMSIALGTVFILNALALIIFPEIGHIVGLSQKQFGFWSALAIHDTSSVVGAGLQYGSEALKIGTTVKLARALWIVPLTFVFSHYFSKTSTEKTKTKKPWFILGFIIVAALFTWIPNLSPMSKQIEFIARRGFVLTLFLIGSGLSKSTLMSVGWRPLLQGILLWILVSSISLFAIYNFMAP